MIMYDGLISNYPAEALRLYGSRLTAYERLEIEHYPEIWFLGLDARKIHGEEGAPQNGGYDDENGSYKVSCFHWHWRLDVKCFKFYCCEISNWLQKPTINLKGAWNGHF